MIMSEVTQQNRRVKTDMSTETFIKKNLLCVLNLTSYEEDHGGLRSEDNRTKMAEKMAGD
jgi:hypothetical protein